MRAWVWVMAGVSLLGSGCFTPVDELAYEFDDNGGQVQVLPGQQRDSGVPDAGVPDAGVPDAGVPDAGVPDAGVPDAGVPDAGVPDAGVPDAGVPDAGLPDAGATSPLGSYRLQFTCVSNCGGTFVHTLFIRTWDMASGAVTGDGADTGDPRHTWTMTGTIAGQSLAMRLVYTGLNPGYVVDMTGSASLDAEPVSGVAQSSFAQTMNWSASRLTP